jgi:hypothetical protein
VLAFCFQSERSHVGGDEGRAAPPPFVAMLLHTINSLLDTPIVISTHSDLQSVQDRPNWMRCATFSTADSSVIAAAAALLNEVRLIRFVHVSPNMIPQLPPKKGKVKWDPFITGVDNAALRLVEGLLPTMRRLELPGCHLVTDVTMLAQSTELRGVNLYRTGVTDEGISGLELVPTLTILLLAECRSVTNVSRLSTSRSLKVLVLTGSSVTEEGIKGVEQIQTLEEIFLPSTIASLTFLSTAKSLRKIKIRHSVTDEGLIGLDRLPFLEELWLQDCGKLTSVSLLSTAKALKRLNLAGSHIANAGLLGLESISTLEEVVLDHCDQISSVVNLSKAPALKKLLLSHTPTTDSGLEGLENAPRLEELHLYGCARVTNVTQFSKCKTLKELHLLFSAVQEEGMRGVEAVAVLT